MARWFAVINYPPILNHHRERRGGVKQRFAQFCLRCGSKAVTLNSTYAKFRLESGSKRGAHFELPLMPVNQIALKPAGFMVKSRQVLRSIPDKFFILARVTLKGAVSPEI